MNLGIFVQIFTIKVLETRDRRTVGLVISPRPALLGLTGVRLDDTEDPAIEWSELVNASRGRQPGKDGRSAEDPV
jgi:hypothetical protein